MTPVFKTFIYSLGIITISLVISRFATQILMHAFPPRSIDQEMLGNKLFERKWALLKVKDQKSDVVRIVGSSISMDVKIQMAGYETINYGFYGTTPKFLSLISQKLSENISRLGAENIALLEFLPQSATRKSTRTLREISRVRESQVRTWGEIVGELPSSTEDATAIIVMKLRGNFSPAVTTNLVGNLIFPRENQKPLPNNELLKINASFQNARYDLIENKVDPMELKYYVSAIQSLKKTFRCLIVYMPPHPVEIWNRSREGENRLSTMIKEVENQTKVKIIALAEKEHFLASDFRDATHLNKSEGTKKLSDLLTDLIASFCQQK